MVDEGNEQRALLRLQLSRRYGSCCFGGRRKGSLLGHLALPKYNRLLRVKFLLFIQKIQNRIAYSSFFTGSVFLIRR